MHQNELILGIDGGGSKTVAWLALHDDTGRTKTIGRGTAGPSNSRSVGFDQAMANLDRAIESAFTDAERSRTIVASACLSLAGADRQSEQQQIRRWAEQRTLSERLTLTNDAIPVLYAATGTGIGIALICGTGSLAIGRGADGTTDRCGGWGGLFGDEGSGYQIGIAGLRAAARAADGRGGHTCLLPRLLEHYEIGNASELIPIIYSESTDRAAIARLGRVVFDAADSGDEVAAGIVASAATALSELVTTLAPRLELANGPFVLGVAGGVLVQRPSFVEQLRRILMDHRLQPQINPVVDPVAGALVLAAAHR